jgi:hypothetical protein
VLSDEVYEPMTYDGNKHTKIATLPDMYNRYVFWQLEFIAQERLRLVVLEKLFLSLVGKLVGLLLQKTYQKQFGWLTQTLPLPLLLLYKRQWLLLSKKFPSKKESISSH